MPGAPIRLGSRAATVVSDLAPAQAIARWWQPLARQWPSYAALPAVSGLKPLEAVRAGREALGDMVIIALDEANDDRLLYQLLDRLWGFDLAALLIGSDLERAEKMSGRGMIAMASGAEPGILAATAAALLERQVVVDQIHDELHISRRFQGGLRGEMEKMHDELQLAASVQREFLPRGLPETPGLAFEVFFRPCSYVSGDIYDVQRIDEHHTGFFLADAAGHGVPAALMTMVMARNLVTSGMVNGELEIMSPANVLGALNEEMIRRRGSAPRFATGVYGVIDCRTREVRIAGAGHPRPLLFSGGAAQAVPTDGALLGVFEDAGFEEVCFTLDEGTMLIIHSDGFETAFPEPGACGYGKRLPTENYLMRFARTAEAWRSEGMEQAMACLEQDLDAQSGSLHQADDLTALLIVPTEREDAAGRPRYLHSEAAADVESLAA